MSIAENIAQVRENIAAAAKEAGRDPKEITLVGASKMNGAQACREAVAAGIDVLGENRVQEMLHMYKHHQDAKLVESCMVGNKIIGEGEYQVPMLSESVSVSEDGTVNITVGNLSVTEDVPVEISFAELAPSHIETAILTGAMCAHNTFEEPENVREAAFDDFKADGRKVSFTAPACSIISFRVQ